MLFFLLFRYGSWSRSLWMPCAVLSSWLCTRITSTITIYSTRWVCVVDCPSDTISASFLVLSVTNQAFKVLGGTFSFSPMGAVRITSWNPKFNGSHFGLPPGSIHKMTGLGGKMVSTMMYAHRPLCDLSSLHFAFVRWRSLFFFIEVEFRKLFCCEMCWVHLWWWLLSLCLHSVYPGWGCCFKRYRRWCKPCGRRSACQQRTCISISFKPSLCICVWEREIVTPPPPLSLSLSYVAHAPDNGLIEDKAAMFTVDGA